MNVTKENVVEYHKLVLERVLAYDYFVYLLTAVQKTYPDHEHLTDPNEICMFWNEFWGKLPDSPSIRRDPFFDICEMAEGSYLEGFDDE